MIATLAMDAEQDSRVAYRFQERGYTSLEGTMSETQNRGSRQGCTHKHIAISEDSKEIIGSCEVNRLSDAQALPPIQC